MYVYRQISAAESVYPAPAHCGHVPPLEIAAQVVHVDGVQHSAVIRIGQTDCAHAATCDDGGLSEPDDGNVVAVLAELAPVPVVVVDAGDADLEKGFFSCDRCTGLDAHFLWRGRAAALSTGGLLAVALLRDVMLAEDDLVWREGRHTVGRGEDVVTVEQRSRAGERRAAAGAATSIRE